MLIFFKNQNDLAEAIKKIIDDYWDLKIKDYEMIEILTQIAISNKELLYKDDEYVAIVRQRLGIKRIRVLEKILKSK